MPYGAYNYTSLPSVLRRTDSVLQRDAMSHPLYCKQKQRINIPRRICICNCKLQLDFFPVYTRAQFSKFNAPSCHRYSTPTISLHIDSTTPALTRASRCRNASSPPYLNALCLHLSTRRTVLQAASEQERTTSNTVHISK